MVPPSAPSGLIEPRWEGVLEPTPELLVVIRPQAVRRDRLYGPLVERAIALARAQSALAAQTGALEAMDDAEEVVIVARDISAEGLGELAVVVRGVRASVDPTGLVDEQGRALWVPGPNAPRPDVRELVRAPNGKTGDAARDAPDASLFELPGRTWVIATGRARTRVRDAFARRPQTSPLAELDALAPVVARLSGPALVARVRALRQPGLLAPVGHQLQSVTVALAQGENAVVRATFAYQSASAAAEAEATVRQALEALSTSKSQDYAWLRPATVQASPCCVVVTTPLPSPLLDGLLH